MDESLSDADGGDKGKGYPHPYAETISLLIETCVEGETRNAKPPEPEVIYHLQGKHMLVNDGKFGSFERCHMPASPKIKDEEA